VAAISTEGFKQLHIQIESVFIAHQQDPNALLIETAWAYVQFAQNDPDRFKLMFSSVIAKERAYPDFVAASQDNFRQLVTVVQTCQQAGILKAGAADLVAVGIWGAVHGLITLILEGQISRKVLDQFQFENCCSTL
jgi:hypothetical protein